MAPHILFVETQRFRQWWLWLIFLAIGGMAVYALVMQLILQQPVGRRPLSNGLLIVTITLAAGIIGFMLSLKLETTITAEGIQVKFFPFVTSFKMYRFSDMQQVYVRRYNPISEYGGWGYRLGILGYGRALNVSGDMGIQLVYGSNKKLLIGTRQPQQVEAILRQLDVEKRPTDNQE